MRDIEIPAALLPAEKLGIAADDILLIRPDGYVAAFGHDLAALQSTLLDLLGQARAEPKKRVAR